MLNIATFITNADFLAIKIQNVSRIALQQKLLSLCPSPFAKIPLIYLIFGRLTLPKYQKDITPAAMGAKHLLALSTFLCMENLRPPEIRKKDNKKFAQAKLRSPSATHLHSNIHQFFFSVSGFLSGLFEKFSMNSGFRTFF